MQANDSNPSAIIGDIAHIEANSDSGPRANTSLTNRQRDSYPNLILLCPNHHRIVDRREPTYTVETLRQWKCDSESRLTTALAQTISNVTFTELEVVTQSLVKSPDNTSTSLSAIPLQDKIARNRLTAKTERLITIGLIQTKQVQTYVETMDGLDRTFIDRLTSRFITEYRDHRQSGLDGDALFDAMRLFSMQGKTDILSQTAGLAVLVYLFERCEVFER